MTRVNKVFFTLFLAAIAVPTFVYGDTYDDASRALDSQIMELEHTRNELRDKLNTCEDKQKKNKIAGIATLATTGAGVTGNILLHQSIEKKSGGGGSGSKIGQDTMTDEQKNCFTIKNVLDGLEGFDCKTINAQVPNISVEYCEACR